MSSANGLSSIAFNGPLLVWAQWTAIIMWCSISGCNKSIPSTKYSGEFLVKNQSDATIWVIDYVGLGGARPKEGWLGPGIRSGGFFPPLSDLPENVTVKWRYDDSDEVFHTEVKLRALVPRGQSGVTQFEFTRDDVWCVQFIPGPPHR